MCAWNLVLWHGGMGGDCAMPLLLWGRREDAPDCLNLWCCLNCALLVAIRSYWSKCMQNRQVNTLLTWLTPVRWRYTCTVILLLHVVLDLFQTEIAKRLNAILAQIIPFLSQEVTLLTTQSLLCVLVMLLLCEWCRYSPPPRTPYTSQSTCWFGERAFVPMGPWQTNASQKALMLYP